MKTLKLLFVFMAITIGLPQAAQARIDILPRIVIIDSRDRSGELTILNLFNETSTFRMDLLNYRQNEDGVYAELETPLNPAFDPAEVVRFSPRQFELTRGGRQKIRLSIRKPADLPEGEYRFHIKALRLANIDTSQSDNSVVQMFANVGVAIPVIVRHGNVQARAALKNPRIIDHTRTDNGRPALQIEIERTGNASAIGALEVLWEQPGEKPKKIGGIANMNVFTEISKRIVTVPLSELPYGQGALKVRYSKGENKGDVYDEIIVQR
ncbi:MAG: hypothetical protein GW903_08410 [Alphaproteobacteria bacterium]|nr:hypothetical protein [Alphaproteobacteria bacterium]NCQ88766.1 hypothetical protein [Alphaproteobacteria bacterium]NCT07311.1 hypothetical protein [Alphaproteobacteria bacterium]